MKILKQIRTIRYHVLLIDLSEVECYPARGVVFGLAGDQLDILDEYKEQGTMEILEQIPKHSRILLLLSGDQLLSRFSEDPNQILFEEIDEEDFFMQKFQSQEGWQIQSACRKSVVDPFIGLIAESKHFLVHISLDPISIPNLEELIDRAVLRACHLRFEFRDHKLRVTEETTQDVDCGTSSEEIVVSGMSYSSANLSLLGSLLHFLKKGPLEIDPLIENTSESKFFVLFQRTAVLLLSVFFAVLLTNFLLFSKIQTRLDQMKTSGEDLMHQIEQIEQMKAQVSEYQKLTNSKAVHPLETYSYFLDEMARSRPSGVWFNKLSIYPLSKKQELNKALELDPSSFLLQGETNDPVSLNRLINTLEEMTWVQDIELMNYESLSDKPGAGFELIIKKVK